MKNQQLSVFNYNVQNSTDDTLDVYIDGAIVDAEWQQILHDWYGDTTSVSFKSVRDEVINSGKRNITFWINSYGGHVGDAMAIHDWIVNLETQGYNIKTNGLGMICSAATYILSASKNSHISKNSYYMIHNVSGGIYGDVNMIENFSKTMRKFNDTIVDFYANLTGKSNEAVTEWMNLETWFTGSEAVTNGFVVNLLDNQEFTNTIPAEAFPYKNKAALNLYNSFVKPENNNDMKLVDLIVNALKEGGFIANKEGDSPKPITAEALTNALTEGLKDFNPEPTEEQLNNSVANFFKDGLPTNVATQIGEAITNATKDLPTNASIETLQKDIKDLQDDVASNKGGAKPKNTASGAENKYEHEGITFDN